MYTSVLRSYWSFLSPKCILKRNGRVCFRLQTQDGRKIKPLIKNWQRIDRERKGFILTRGEAVASMISPGFCPDFLINLVSILRNIHNTFLLLREIRILMWKIFRKYNDNDNANFFSHV